MQLSAIEIGHKLKEQKYEQKLKAALNIVQTPKTDISVLILFK